ncbi:MAG: protoheme IX farnesyltransferase [Omnitrophica bacterium RIFCSPHIGHO2_02_FULL_51_18]|nr:MAG: protoheme IX farnesyltransferase [Omnitrophica bacterium RIFCSPHIGHO2_02_FULL_51_18]
MNKKAYLELTKPRLVLLALLASISSFYMASKGALDTALLFHALLGSALVGGGANALNQFIERDLDAKMARTQNRPIPSGRVPDKKALLFGALFSLGGLLYLFLFVNKFTSFVGFLVPATYVFLYTPLKRKTPLNTFVGALSGALPVLLGWTAVNPSLNLEAMILFSILFAWQIPHFLAIAWVYKEDYLKGGFKMFGADDSSGQTLGWHIVAASLVLFALSLAPTFMGITGLTYLFMAVFFGVNLCGFAIYLATHRLSYAKQFIYASIIYLFTLNISMVVDKAG